MDKKLKKSRKNKDYIEIYGFHAVQAALKNKLRKHSKLTISSNIFYKLSQNLEHKVNRIITLSNRDFCKIYGNDKNHQGIVLETSKLVQPSLDSIIKKTNDKKTDIIIMLDRVTDPNNIGSIMRSCALFNCNSIIIAKDNSPDITSSMIKAASGAIEVVNYIKVTNISRAIDKFKKNNYWVFGFDNNYNYINNNLKLPKKCLLIFGAEGKGIRKLTKKYCDQILSIPINYNTEFGIDSLNVSNACSIVLYEIFIRNN